MLCSTKIRRTSSVIPLADILGVIVLSSLLATINPGKWVLYEHYILVSVILSKTSPFKSEFNFLNFQRYAEKLECKFT